MLIQKINGFLQQGEQKVPVHICKKGGALCCKWEGQVHVCPSTVPSSTCSCTATSIITLPTSAQELFTRPLQMYCITLTVFFHRMARYCGTHWLFASVSTTDRKNGTLSPSAPT